MRTPEKASLLEGTEIPIKPALTQLSLTKKQNEKCKQFVIYGPIQY